MNAQKILVPVDFSTGQKETMKLASSLARDTGATLVIVHVEEPAVAYSVGGAYYGAANPRHEDVVAMLHEVVPAGSDIEFEHRCLSGVPAEAIIHCAREIDADFIVMGTHGRTGLKRVLMGSVAESVVRRAPCPVVTVKEGVAETAETS